MDWLDENNRLLGQVCHDIVLPISDDSKHIDKFLMVNGARHQCCLAYITAVIGKPLSWGAVEFAFNPRHSPQGLPVTSVTIPHTSANRH